MVRAERIELSSPGWKPRAHPIYHASFGEPDGNCTRVSGFADRHMSYSVTDSIMIFGAAGENRTLVCALATRDPATKRRTRILPATTSDV